MASVMTLYNVVSCFIVKCIISFCLVLFYFSLVFPPVRLSDCVHLLTLCFTCSLQLCLVSAVISLVSIYACLPQCSSSMFLSCFPRDTACVPDLCLVSLFLC